MDESAFDFDATNQDSQVQISEDGGTVWVHAPDGSTVGRFSRLFGLDVHTTATDQIAGASQCLECTHEPPGPEEWHRFVNLMWQHYQIKVPRDIVTFD